MIGRAEDQEPGAAPGGAAARRARLQQGDAGAGARQAQRGQAPGDAGAEDDDVGAQRQRRQRLPADRGGTIQ
jgi:hypothetical protein